MSRTSDPSCETRCESESTGSPLDSEPLDCLLDCQLERLCVKLSAEEPRFDIRARETRCDVRLQGVAGGAGGAVVASPAVKSCTLSEPRLGLESVGSSSAVPAPSGPVVATLAPARGLNCLALKLAEALFCAGKMEGSDPVRLCAGDGAPAVSISLGSRLVREHAGLEDLRFRGFDRVPHAGGHGTDPACCTMAAILDGRTTFFECGRTRRDTGEIARKLFFFFAEPTTAKRASPVGFVGRQRPSSPPPEHGTRVVGTRW